MEQIDFIGEIGFHYLNYVEDILAQNPAVKFPCIKRDMAETVDSFFLESSAIDLFQYLKHCSIKKTANAIIL